MGDFVVPLAVSNPYGSGQRGAATPVTPPGNTPVRTGSTPATPVTPTTPTTPTAPTNPLSPYANGFAGGSTDPNVFTTNQYSHDLNQNMQAWMSNTGQAPGFSQSQFDNAYNQYMTPGNFNSAAYIKALGLGGDVTQQELANPNSNLYQVPQVQQGQPYQHFMQALDFGNGPMANPASPTNPYGYNKWSTASPYTAGQFNQGGGQQQSQPWQPSPYAAPGPSPNQPPMQQQPQAPAGGGAYSGFNTPMSGMGAGSMAQAQSGQSVPGNGFNPSLGQYNWSSPMAGGFNAWGNPLMGNPYAFMTGQPNNGLFGGSIFQGAGGMPNFWSPFGASMAQGFQNPNGSMPNFNFGFTGQNVPSSGVGGPQAQGFNPMMNMGSMGNYAALLNAMFGLGQGGF